MDSYDLVFMGHITIDDIEAKEGICPRCARWGTVFRGFCRLSQPQEDSRGDENGQGR